MIHLLLGADEYLAAEWLAAQKAALGDPELAGLNTVELTGNQPAATVLGEAAMMPFLCDRRLLIVRGLFDAYEKRMAASKSDAATVYVEMAHLLDGLRGVPATCVLFLWITLWISGADCGKVMSCPQLATTPSAASAGWRR